MKRFTISVMPLVSLLIIPDCARHRSISQGKYVINIEADGTSLVNGRQAPFDGRTFRDLNRDSYIAVIIIPVPALRCGSLAVVLDSILSLGAQRIFLSDGSSTSIRISTSGAIPVGGWGDAVRNFPEPVILLEKGDSVRMRG
ncbi:hypothetical protein GX441_11570 [bacterium]|nr:hypothetical protein [bacterium]